MAPIPSTGIVPSAEDVAELMNDVTRITGYRLRPARSGDVTKRHDASRCYSKHGDVTAMAEERVTPDSHAVVPLDKEHWAKSLLHGDMGVKSHE